VSVWFLASVASQTEAVVARAAGFFDVILDRFGELGGIELDIPPRAGQARAADLRQVIVADVGAEVIDPWRSP
jgi:hypothetical protein